MTQNDNEISDLFFRNISEPEPLDKSTEESLTEDTSANTSNEPEAAEEPEFEVADFSEPVVPTDNNVTELPAENHYETTVIKKKRSMLAPVVGICILLAVTITAVWYVLSHGDNAEESSIHVSLDTLFDFHSPIDEALGADEISEMLLTQSSKLDASFTIVSFPDTPEFSGLSMDYLLMRDIDKKKASAEVAFSYRKAAMLSATAYADKDNICLKIPSLSPGVFTIDSSNIGSQIEKSPLFTEFNETADECSLFLDLLDSFNIEDLFSSVSTAANDIDLLSTVINKLASTYPEDYKKIVNGITSESIEADSAGNEGTKITLSEESIELFIKDILTLALDDKDCKSFLDKYFQLLYSANSDSVNANTSFDDIMDDIYSRMRIALVSAGTAFAESFNQDISLTIYKNAKGQLVSLTSKNLIEADGEFAEINFYITSQSSENPADSMTFQIDFSADGETISIKLINICNRNSEELKHQQSLVFSDADEIMAFSHSRSYNTKSGNYKESFDVLNNSDKVLNLNLNGTMNKGSGYSFTINSMELEAADEIIFSAVGEISISKLNEEILKPAGTEYRIFEMSKEEWEPIIENISDNMDSLERTFDSYNFNN